MPSVENYQWCFDLMIYPLYVNALMDARKLHEIETFDTRTIINEIMTKFYYYIVAADLAENPYTAPPAVTTAKIPPLFK